MNDKFDSLSKAAAPLIAWLKENGDPHTMIIVEPDHIRVTQDVMGLPVHQNN